MKPLPVPPAIALPLLLLGALRPAGAATQERADAGTAPKQDTSKLHRVREPIPDDWAESPDKHRRMWQSQMSAAQYRAALVSSGMADALSGRSLPLVGNWEQKGPVGDFGNRNGRVAGIELRAAGGGYELYAGACSGGLWSSLSTSLGVWTPIGDNLPNPSVRGFAVHPTNPSLIVVGTGDWARSKGAGMFRSEDGGVTWVPTTLPAGIAPEYFYRVLFVPGAPDTLLAACELGILRSDDTGTTWTWRLAGHCTDLLLDSSSPLVGYACIRAYGVFKTVDNGLNWTHLADTDLPPPGQFGRASLAICRDDPSNVAMIVESANQLKGVYRTTDGGADWQDITGALGSFGGDQIDHAQAIAIRPDDPDQIFIGAVTIARSDDGGASWKVGETATGITVGHADITQLHFDPITGNDVLWICNDGGIYKHQIGGTTLSVNGGANGLVISQIDFIDADRTMRVIGLQDNGIVRTVDGAQTWTPIVNADGGPVAIMDAETFHFWYVDGVWGGNNPWHIWRLLYGGSPEDSHDPDYSKSLLLDPFGDRVYTTGTRELFSRSASGSLSGSWTQELTDLQTDPYSIRGLNVSPVDGRTLFVSYWGGNPSNYRDLTFLRRNGTTWSVQNHVENLEPTSELVGAVAPSSQWADECWVLLKGTAGTPKILHTRDYAAVVEDVTGNLAQFESIRSVQVYPFDPRVIYAGTDVGVFRTTNGGETWEPLQDGLPVTICRRLQLVVDDLHTGDHKLVLATYGRGTWERSVPGPPILYVDKNYAGVENGTYEHPYDTIAEAVAVAPAGAIIAIRGGSYAEPQTITKGLTLVTFGGTTVVH